MRKSVLIAGGAGFVGFNLSSQLKNKYPELKVIALDNLKRRGSELNIPFLKSAGVEFIHGDIRNKEDLQFDDSIDYVIDAAAEPSVLAGLNGIPDYLINTNLNGTINLLSLATKHHSKFIFLSTSRVYPICSLEQLSYTETETRFELSDNQAISGCSKGGIAEDFPLLGARSFYGTTKLASELIIQEYEAFNGLQAVINRCGVIAGPRQMGKVDQGVVVLWMARHFWKKDLSYIGYNGSGKQVRDVMHILDLFDLVDFEINNFNKVVGKTFNVGGGIDVSFSLQELTKQCAEITGNRVNIEKVLENRVGDIPIYISDHNKVTKELGWIPKRDLKNILFDIYEWLQKDEKQLKNILAS
ncbi:MAG: NAD-dependent epimerase/dehydratase family protein [Prevotellaceae bacterium]|jgi:CDP-paratose 2-epimerase|nr:NAD-dependent epimerase/dehydratase family protein [Prevotellaceae bacterium]